MKKIIYGMAALVALFSASCSSDDNNNNSGEQNSNTYLPLTTGSYWVYDSNVQSEEGQMAGRDSLYVANDTIINNVTYKKFKTADVPSGFFSGALSGNGIRQSGSQLLVTGATSFTFTEEFPISIAITDFAFFDASAAPGAQIGTTSGTIQQTYQGLPLNFNYALTTKAGDNYDTRTVNGVSYTNVKTVIATINLSVTSNVFGTTATVIPAQDVLTTTQYYAKDKGMVGASTIITYSIDAALASSFGLPATTTINQQETLDTYHID